MDSYNYCNNDYNLLFVQILKYTDYKMDNIKAFLRFGDKMKYKYEKVNRDYMFSIGKDAVRNEFIMAITVTWVAWYEQYFSISKDEFVLYNVNLPEFMNIYNECRSLGTKSSRFLCSDMVKENTPQQLERLREGK